MPLVGQPPQILRGEGVWFPAEFTGDDGVFALLGEAFDVIHAKGDERLFDAVAGAAAVEGHVLMPEDFKRNVLEDPVQNLFGVAPSRSILARGGMSFIRRMRLSRASSLAGGSD